MNAKRKSSLTWSRVKRELSALEEADVLRLLHDLYGARPENRDFMHARLRLAEVDSLEPYKKTIERWISPNVLRNQNVSVTNARKAISDYRSADGDPEALAELMVFYCEKAVAFSKDCGLQDEGFLNALVRIFGQALKQTRRLPNPEGSDFTMRLQEVSRVGHELGYGVGDDMESLLDRHAKTEPR